MLYILEKKICVIIKLLLNVIELYLEVESVSFMLDFWK